MTRKCLKIGEWPAADRAAWDALLHPGGLFEDAGALAHLRPATRWSYEQSYGHWLGFLGRHGIDLAMAFPTERATDALVVAWVEDMAGLADTTRHTRVVGLHRVLTAMEPRHPHPLLGTLCRRFERLANRQIRKGKIGRVVPTADLVKAGLDWLEQAKGESFRDAIRFRDGLMVAMLALMPMRRGNFQTLEIGRSFIAAGNGYSVHLRAEDTKSGRPFEAAVAPVLVPRLDNYLATFRPVLLGNACSPHAYLWANDWGAPYTYGNLGARISRLTEKMLGVAVHPHLFRDAAATTIARYAPAQARAIRGVLGHASTRTADRHYNQAKTLDASRSYAALVEELAGAESPAHACAVSRRRGHP